MKILVDMNLSPLWVQFFAARGIEAVHWPAVGDASALDSQILDYAASKGFVLFTHDLDFGMILAARFAENSGQAPSIRSTQCR